MTQQDLATIAKAIRQSTIFTHLDRETVRCIALLIRGELEATHPRLDGAQFMEACGFKPRFNKGDQP